MSQHIHMPGTLPFHMMHEAPRLKERSVISRIAFCALGLACCGGIVVAFFSIWSLWMPDPPQTPPASRMDGPNTYISLMHGTEPHHRRKAPIQRSVIQRLAMLKRAPGGKGVDMQWVSQMFPHWVHPEATGEPLRFEVQATLEDLVLAVAYLSQAEMED